MPQEDNKRIAKNTLLLYFRTIVIMTITLYTSRVILNALGVENYGIYNVVGGVVAMFSLVSGSFSASISRFITFELGTGNIDRLKVIFSTSVNIQLGLSLVVLLLGEVLGGWFLNTHMNIPEERMAAANWVLHCSLAMFCINLISLPYNACIIAHEKMSAFAYISILEALLKLLVCYLIVVSPFDKLISYAMLLVLVSLIIRLVYGIYCKRNFEECSYFFCHDRKRLKEMLGFSGWSFFTHTNYILNTQGVNMLMNIYFGVTVNAARGIATQVEGAVMQFVNNFTMAVNPQITKSYASGNLKRMHYLVCEGAKFSYFAMLLMALPIIFEAREILSIWLTVVPEHTVVFVQLSLVLGMCDCVGTSGYTACMASGKIRKYSLVITPLGLLEFPFVWIAFYLGAPVVSAYYLYVLVKMIVIIARLFLLREMIGLRVRTFVKSVFQPMALTTAAAVVLPVLIVSLLPQSLFRLMLTAVVGVTSVAFSSLYLGMTVSERSAIIDKATHMIKRFKS